MKIGIESTSAVLSQKAGVGHYTYHLLRQFLLLPERAHQYTLYFRNLPIPLSQGLGLPDKNTAEFIPKVMRWPYLWAQCRLPFELWRHKQDVYFFPSYVLPLAYFPENSVMTLHDVAFLFFPECFSPALRRWLTLATERGVHRARRIIAVSEATRQDIIAYYGVAPEKIVAIHHGVHEHYQPLPSRQVLPIQQKYALKFPYILCVGTLQRRKNIPRLLQAFYLLKQKYHVPHTLVLVGQDYPDLPEHEIHSTIERLTLREDVILPGYIPDSEMPALVNGAEIFILPSLYEGFGMPLLEAMACGTPVACSNTSSLPEVAGDAGVLFDPYHVDEIVTALYRLIEDEKLRGVFARKGLQRARQFSWKRCAEHTLDVLESFNESH